MAIADINVESLSEGLTTGFHRLRLGDLCVPVRYHQGQSDTLVIIFHGAIDREKRETPWYQSFIPNLGPHHQLSIPDPTLGLASDIGMAWYLGGVDMPLQSQIPKIISAISAVAGIKKRIYLGGSSGGFAALYYSWADPKSACVTINPQVNVHLYNKGITDTYLKHAWPEAEILTDIEGKVVLDIPKLYSESFRNTVIYVQSTGDKRHFSRHLSQFAKVGLANPDRFILNCGYWGIPNHSNSAPSPIYYPWVRALAAAPKFDKQTILDTHYALQTHSSTISPQKPQTIKDRSPDTKMANVLRDYQLRSVEAD